MKELAFIGAENRTAVGSLVDGIEHEVGSLFLSLFVCVCVWTKKPSPAAGGEEVGRNAGGLTADRVWGRHLAQ